MSDNLLLKGLKVIDAGSFIAGPVSTTILSDFGAEVIKIEPPKIGDSLRHLIERTKRVNPSAEEDYCWQLTSRNKKSLALDSFRKRPRNTSQTHQRSRCFCD